eukprot:138537_1
MESILSSLQNIRKPSFLRSDQKETATNDQSAVQPRHAPVPTTNINSFQNVVLNKSASDLPPISFADFGEWDVMPYNSLFIRERLRRRIEANKAEYAKHGITPQSIPLNEEIKCIQDILISGGTVSELRMSARAPKLSVILSYSKAQARPVTKPISQLKDTQLSTIIDKYNNLRRTTLIDQPCLLCGIYDLYFLAFILAIVKRVNIKLINQKLMQFLTKSLIYCLIGMHRQNMDAPLDINVIRDTTLDLLNYEAIHTLLSCITNQCDICYHCRVKYNTQNKGKNTSDKWFSALLSTLVNHGFNLNKVIKNASLKHETALMNIYNCQWLDLQQVLMINLAFQPFKSVNVKEDYVNKWLEFGENLLCQLDNLRNDKKEFDRFALEIQLTIFESFLKAVIEHKYLYRMIDFLYDKLKRQQSSWNEYDILITLLFCGHYKGYEYMFTLLRNSNDESETKTLFVTQDYLNIFAIFESFDVLLSVTNVISSNLKDIGKIIAVRSCLFHHKFSRKYDGDINEALMEEYLLEFIECLKILFYDYGLYDFDTDALYRQSTRNIRNKYKKKLPPSVLDKDKTETKEMETHDEDETFEIADDTCEDEAEESEIYYVEMISMGLKAQKTFLMECPYLHVEILRCLLELQAVDEAFVVDRFRNTYDFVAYEMKFNVTNIWDVLQKEVFLYNKNVFLFRRMKRKQLRLLFRRIIRVVVSIEYRQWIKEYIMNGDTSECKMDKNMQIQKRAAIEDKYKLPDQTMLLIQQYV